MAGLSSSQPEKPRIEDDGDIVCVGMSNADFSKLLIKRTDLPFAVPFENEPIKLKKLVVIAEESTRDV
jgi:hypothetical protein